MTVTVFGYLILISIDFYDLFLRFLLSLFRLSRFTKHSTVFDHISKHLEVWYITSRGLTVEIVFAVTSGQFDNASTYYCPEIFRKCSLYR